ncbi:MAG: hypothetical protein IJP17_04295, partial [Clostridia bacterium]|nr:hypothetical protein [Clostridia bacterium]
NVLQTLKLLQDRGYVIKHKDYDTDKEGKVSFSALEQDFEKKHGKQEIPEYRAPIFIGVAAHDNDSADKAKIRARAGEFFAEINKKFGQDKLHTFAAAEQEEKRVTPVYLLSLLSNSLEELVSDEASKYGIATIHVVNPGDLPKQGKLCIEVEGDCRRFIVDNCFALLALWNGTRYDRGCGVDPLDDGVEEMVVLSLKGRIMEEGRSVKLKENRSVCHIVVPASGDKGLHIPYQKRWLYPYPVETGSSWFYTGCYCLESDKSKIWSVYKPLGDKKRQKSVSGEKKYTKERFDNIVENISRFNAVVSDNLRDNSEGAIRKGRVFDLLKNLHGSKTADADNLKYLFYDGISVKSQKKKRMLTGGIALTACLGFCAHCLYSDCFDAPVLKTIAIMACAAFFIIALVLFVVGRTGKYHNDYINFRIIAEALRVQTYWDAAGISDNVAERYTERQKNELEWVKLVLRAWRLDMMVKGVKPEPECDNVKVLRRIGRTWLGIEDEARGGEHNKYNTINSGQYNYVRKKAKKTKKAQAREDAINLFGSSAVVITAFALCVIVLLINFTKAPEWLEVVEKYLVLGVGILSAVVAAFAFAGATLANKQETDRLSWSRLQYKKVLMDIEEAQQPGELREIFKRIGSECIVENGEWALILADKNTELPFTG